MYALNLSDVDLKQTLHLCSVVIMTDTAFWHWHSGRHLRTGFKKVEHRGSQRLIRGAKGRAI